MGGGLMFMGSDRLVGSGCRSGMGGCLFVVLSLCCVVRVVAVRRGWETDGYLFEVTTWHSCHVVSTIHTLLQLLSMLLSMCAMGFVGGQSRLLAVVAVGEMVGVVGMVGVDGGGWEGRIVHCLFIVDDNKLSVGVCRCSLWV